MPALLSDRDLLARLVAFDTTSQRSNLALADDVAAYLDAPGVRISRFPSADGQKTNLVVAAGPERPDGGGLILSGHMDVVPAEENDWRTDPFSLADCGDRYTARGSADMKGFLALAMNRLAAADPRQLLAPLVLLFTYDEEVGTLGARRFVEQHGDAVSLPRAAIIGEPTGLRVVRSHKGMLRLRLVLEGQAAHSGYPHLGRSAIEPAARAIVALAELRRTMEAERLEHSSLFPEVPYPALNVGTVQGGSAANVIPDRCEVQIGIRLLPGMTTTAVAERVRETLSAALGAEGFALEVVSESPAMMTAAGSSLAGALHACGGHRQDTGVMYATDAGWLQRLGMECVLFGPGSIEDAHRANEALPIGEFREAGAVLDRLIERLCRQT